jgi:hypothetical protein
VLRDSFARSSRKRGKNNRAFSTFGNYTQFPHAVLLEDPKTALPIPQNQLFLYFFYSPWQFVALKRNKLPKQPRLSGLLDNHSAFTQ